MTDTNHWFFVTTLGLGSRLWVCGHCGTLSVDYKIADTGRSAMELHRNVCPTKEK